MTLVWACTILTATAAAAAAVRHDQLDSIARTEARAIAARERSIRDLDIGFFRARMKQDTTGSLDAVRLGALLLARSRVAGSTHDLVEAESLARHSLRHGGRRNEGALGLLVASLLAQHRFPEALAAADRLVATADSTPRARAIRAEVLLELGRYTEADSAFSVLWPLRYDPAVGTRLVRWAEVRGRASVARDLLATLATQQAEHPESVPSVRAWYPLRLAELALRYRRPAEASRWLAEGLALAPDDPRLLAVQARVALAEGRLTETMALGQRALADRFDPTTLATLATAARRLGDSAAATQYRLAAKASTDLSSGFHRAMALFLLEDDADVAEVVAKARTDVASRPDVYGWDVLAWALHRAGRNREAAEAIQKAVRWNSEDPVLQDHAAAILGATR